MPVRLVATDLDGTILCRGVISPRTIAAFDRITRAGATFVLVTGRPPRSMARISAAFGNQGVALCSNGAFSYDMRSASVVAERAIPPDVLALAARRLREAIPGIGIAIEHAFALDADHAYQPDLWDSDVELVRMDDAGLFARPGAKLLGRHPDFTADDLLALARPAVGGILNVYHSNGANLIEAVATGVSKATAVASVAAELGIPPSEVIAFGDMPNDQPLLSWAGTSYAVANAHPEVLAAATHVIPSCESDGVAQILEHLFP
jgi:hydroxymethylpyrimidine pyrophosphatase-like HAD family hydrolase